MRFLLVSGKEQGKAVGSAQQLDSVARKGVPLRGTLQRLWGSTQIESFLEKRERERKG